MHFPGDTRHLSYGPGEYLLHSVENIGDTDLLFTTVEFLQSANPPLPVPDGVRLQGVVAAVSDPPGLTPFLQPRSARPVQRAPQLVVLTTGSADGVRPGGSDTDALG